MAHHNIYVTKSHNLNRYEHKQHKKLKLERLAKIKDGVGAVWATKIQDGEEIVFAKRKYKKSSEKDGRYPSKRARKCDTPQRGGYRKSYSRKGQANAKNNQET